MLDSHPLELNYANRHLYVLRAFNCYEHFLGTYRYVLYYTTPGSERLSHKGNARRIYVQSIGSYFMFYNFTVWSDSLLECLKYLVPTND
jgi:hypothetical protein